ncbi:MAG TPA: MFS transporter [Solirubrobacteraceae bacterium]|nr:MFS transporter [Solirubrobacteraceae bacterium]
MTGQQATAGHSHGATPIEQLGRRRRVTILLICCMSLLIVGLDVTIVNVALPSIGREFGASVSGLQWTIDAYTLVLASFLMLAGSVADRFGRRRVFLTGLSVFSAGSLLCSTAPSLALLIVFRMVQALGGSMLNPVAMSIITNTFTHSRERAQAVGVWGAAVGVSMAAGPVVGGLLVSGVGWRSVFWINIPIGLAAIALALRFVPESRAPKARRFDPVGQVLIIVLFATLTFGIIELPKRGLGSPLILAAFAAAAAALVGILVYEPRRREPLIDLRFFRSIPFSTATVTAVASFAALGGFLFMNTLYLQDVRGLSPLHAGLATLPMAAVTVIASPFSGRIVGVRGPRLPLVAAGACLTVACLALTRIDATTPFTWLFAAYVVFGLGFGLVNAPITNAAVSGMPRAQAGVASAVASTSRQIGQTLGVAITGAIVASSLGGAAHSDLAHASHVAWWLLAGCGAVVLVLGFVATSRHATETARRTAAELNPEVLGSAAG